MKFGKIVIAGIAVTILNAIIGMVSCGGIFNWVYKLEPTNVWKAMDGAPGIAYFIGSLVLSIALAFVYALINKGIPGKNKPLKGSVFGLLVWLIGILPGMFATYTFMTVATTVVIYWTIFGLFTNIVNGIVIAYIYGE